MIGNICAPTDHGVNRPQTISYENRWSAPSPTGRTNTQRNKPSGTAAAIAAAPVSLGCRWSPLS
jgi:hypothetical protein